jgi:hypothetical protein
MLGVYLVISMLFAALVIKGGVEQTSFTSLQYGVCALSAFCAGKWVRRYPVKRKGYILLPAALFSMGYATFVSVMCMPDMQPEKAGLFALSALIGGTLAMGKKENARKGKRLRK